MTFPHNNVITFRYNISFASDSFLRGRFNFLKKQEGWSWNSEYFIKSKVASYRDIACVFTKKELLLRTFFWEFLE